MANPTKNAPAAAGEKAKAKRVLGPRKLFIIFKPGTDRAYADEVNRSIQEITMNGRAMLDRLSGGDVVPFITRKIEVTARADGDSE
jgi:hypothetical protein